MCHAVRHYSVTKGLLPVLLVAVCKPTDRLSLQLSPLWAAMVPIAGPVPGEKAEATVGSAGGLVGMDPLPVRLLGNIVREVAVRYP